MTRHPIVLGEHSIALLTIFSRSDYIDDLWAIDWILEDTRDRHKRSARQFIEALEGHWSVNFLKSLRDEIDETIEAHQKEFALSSDPQSSDAHGAVTSKPPLVEP